MFGSLRIAVDSLGANVSIQEISKIFVQVIQQVYSRHVAPTLYFEDAAGVSLNKPSSLSQVNELANDMVKEVFEANNKYLQDLYAHINTRSGDIGSIMRLHCETIIRAIEQHHLKVLAAIGPSNDEPLHEG
jgi:hypothetical protein